MRISSGSLKGRTFYPPADKWPTRPTTDYSRTALFNILTNFLDFESTKMLDLFGGTGAHSYEMISRGCTDVTYVDKFRPAVQFVLENIKNWKIDSYFKIIHSDYLQFISQFHTQFDYIFAGPPYDLINLEAIPDQIFDNNVLKVNGLFVLEHNPKFNFKDHFGFQQVRNYGQTYFSFFINNKAN
ncbi:MAG: RsmD family RNA methyltransferase [Saprospiraceae bacterium]|nr:RsmD family RNA methyltransferase [Saprospiraceae bacterium]